MTLGMISKPSQDDQHWAPSPMPYIHRLAGNSMPMYKSHLFEALRARELDDLVGFKWFGLILVCQWGRMAVSWTGREGAGGMWRDSS